MAIFTEAEYDWQRIDVRALVFQHGLATINEEQRAQYHAWLIGQHYRITSLDCRVGLNSILTTLSELFRWQEEFGYILEEGNRNLDALRDGFKFNVPEEGGVVFELYHPDVIWKEDARWLSGLLAIACEHSRYQLTLGRQFFTLLVQPKDSPVIGQTIEIIQVPAKEWQLFKNN